MGVSPARLTALASDMPRHIKEAWAIAVATRLPAVHQLIRNLRDEQHNEITILIEEVEREGLRKTARRRGTDPSNLRRRMAKLAALACVAESC